MMRGRRRKYQSNAERQRAYRHRKKVTEQSSLAGLFLQTLAHGKTITLRKYLEHHKNEAFFIDTNPRVTVHRLMRNDFVHAVIEDLVFEFLKHQGYIEFYEKRHGSHIYIFTDKFKQIRTYHHE